MSLEKSHLNCNSYIVTNSRAIEKQFLNKNHEENQNVLCLTFCQFTEVMWPCCFTCF